MGNTAMTDNFMEFFRKIFKRKPKYKEAHYSQWCAVKVEQGRIVPRLRMVSEPDGSYKSVEADVNALLYWVTITPKK